ncbi:hypothetical protein C9374_011811 [Naegleria lovaniensis]|uniref:Uncharacterized protein n=1 Tax=Naegleria lovaniensis TaxID=51637 RepID=A0AA88GDS3_NAELO|nr:uncharacterized protein C9374_011811 [Naegleria lovaniensis]KAG2373722.1 hypothetical protein C9374_011811 [Naegleria lovaniensis]
MDTSTNTSMVTVSLPSSQPQQPQPQHPTETFLNSPNHITSSSLSSHNRNNNNYYNTNNNHINSQPMMTSMMMTNTNHPQQPASWNTQVVSSHSVHPSMTNNNNHSVNVFHPSPANYNSQQPFMTPNMQHSSSFHSSPSSSSNSYNSNNSTMHVVHSNHISNNSHPLNHYQFPVQQQQQQHYSSKQQHQPQQQYLHVNNNYANNNNMEASHKMLPSISEWFRGGHVNELTPPASSQETCSHNVSSSTNTSSILMTLNQKNVQQPPSYDVQYSQQQQQPSNSITRMQLSCSPPQQHHEKSTSPRIVQSKSLLRSNSDSSGSSMSPNHSSSHNSIHNFKTMIMATPSATSSQTCTGNQTQQAVTSQIVSSCPNENVRKPNRGKAPNRQSHISNTVNAANESTGVVHTTQQPNTCVNNRPSTFQDQQSIMQATTTANQMDLSHASPVKVATTVSVVETRPDKRHNSSNISQQEQPENKKDGIVLVIENVESIKQYIAEKEMAQQQHSSNSGSHSRRISAKEVWNSIAAATAANNGKFPNENKIKKQSKMKHSRANSPMSMGSGSVSPSVLERRFSNVSLFEKLSLEDADMKTSIISSTSLQQDHNMTNHMSNGMNNNHLQCHNTTTGPFMSQNANPSPQQQQYLQSPQTQQPSPIQPTTNTSSNVHLLGNEFVDFSKGEHEIQKKTRGEKVYKFKMIKF